MRALAILAAFFLGGVALCTNRQSSVLRQLSEIKPISAVDPQQAVYFYLVGYQKGEPAFVRLSDLQPDNTHEEVETFYIPSGDVSGLTARLNKTLTDSTQRLAALDIERDEQSAQTQRVHLHFISDEFEYFSVYDVNGRRVTPVAFGDITKRDYLLAFSAGIKFFLAAIAVGIAVAIAVSRIWPRRHAITVPRPPTPRPPRRAP